MMTTNDLSRPVKIHLCKDRTLSYRRNGEPIFNGVALPVFSVETEEEAEALFTLVGTTQHIAHPHPKFKHSLWRKLFNGVGGWRQTLLLEHCDEASNYLRKSYALIREAAHADQT